ncbi:MFS transporter [Micromonospora sp. DT62]|uniref:MFS transporter n=1 Tax=Micromonospora sp. DT62 TaxID=3416521 RepID=UPI003CEB8C4E
MVAASPQRRTTDSPADGRRAFWHYWAASATSEVGSGISAVALPLLAISALHASNFEVGLLTAANYAAIILVGLPAGVIVQRLDLRRVQITTDLARALALVTIPVAVWFDALTLTHLLSVAFVIGLATNFFVVANSTFLPEVVPREELTRRNGLISGTSAASQLGGPALGGVLVQTVGAAYAIVIDAVSYLASAVLLGRIPVRPRTVEPSSGQQSFGGQIKAGLAFVWRHPVMRPSLLGATAANFANGALLAVTPIFLIHTLDLPAGAVGVVLAADGVGALLAAAYVARLVDRLGDARTLLIAPTVGAVLALAMLISDDEKWGVVPFVVGMLGLAAGVTMLSVVTRTHRQMFSPRHLLSRVMASVRFISWGAIPIGALVAGAVSELWSPRAGLVVVCVAAAGMPLAVWASRIRTLTTLEEGEPGPRDPAE